LNPVLLKYKKRKDLWIVEHRGRPKRIWKDLVDTDVRRDNGDTYLLINGEG